FNHAIVAVESTPGSYILMDPTNETTTEFLPAMLGNMSYLVARPEGETLLRSPVVPAEANRMTVSTTAKLLASGELRGATEFGFGGVNDTIYRNFFSSGPRDAARQFFAAMVRRCIPGGELLDFSLEPADLRDMSQPLRAKITYTARDYVPVGGGGFPLAAPLFGDRVGASAFVLRGATGLLHRKYPLQLFSTTSGVETFSMELPAALAVEGLPDREEADLPGVAAFRSGLECHERTFSGRREFETSTVELTPGDYNVLKAMLCRKDFADRHAAAVASFDYSAVKPADLRREFPDSDLLVLSADRQVSLKDSHSWSERYKTVSRILTYAGMKEMSEVKVPFEDGRETVGLSARVTMPDGRVMETRPEDVKVVDLPVDGAAARYPLKKQAVLPLPGAAVGATVEVELTRSTSMQPFFHIDEPFASREAVLKKKLTVECPSAAVAAGLRCQEPPPQVGFSRTEHGGVHRFEWSARNLPVVRSEAGQPPDRMFMPSVSVTHGNLKMYAAELNAALKKAAADQPETIKKAQIFKLNFASTKPDAEWFGKRLRRIRDFVADGIISAGPAFNTMPLDRIFPADRTLADGSGNSADKAVLLAAILNELGIETRFVAASGMGADAAAQMSFARQPGNYFDHILVYLPEHRIYLNDRSKYAPPGVTASEGRIGLDLETGALLTVTPPRQFATRDRTNFSIKLKDNGSAEIEVVRRVTGRAMEAANHMFSQFTPELRRRHFDALAGGFSQAARISGEPQTDFTGNTGTITYRVAVPDFAARTGDFMEFMLPGFDQLLARLGAISTDRKTPYRRNEAVRLEKSYDIDFPDGYTMVDRRPLRSDFGVAGSARKSESCRRESDQARIEIELDLPVETVQPGDYSRLVQLQRELAAPSAGRVVFEKKQK
ncbi:MAG: DUF3857 and transglutaminase domain-containing protein, partial [Victivallaceae bacterium]|nr:DUF3857 and transglutaminase domain-containing protein [Victivallaceae bacterium]